MNEVADKVFMWIFDNRDFAVKDIAEIADYEINIDEETNANSIIKILKETIATAEDIVAIKKNNEVIYWGMIDNIQNEDGKQLYEYFLKYITNMFNQSVPASKNVKENEIEEGVNIIKSALDITKVVDVANAKKENGTNIRLCNRNNADCQKWKFTKTEDGYYIVTAVHSGKALDVQDGGTATGTNVWQIALNGSDAQKWKVKYDENGYYNLISKCNGLYLDVQDGLTATGTNIRVVTKNDSFAQKFILEANYEQTIKEKGIEDFLAETINRSFINNVDELVNKKYLEVRAKTHTRLQTKVTNVENGLYNLNTYMSNCTQLYNINYNIFIENKKLIIEIEKKENEKVLIDINAHVISNYVEVFETDVVSKVEVLTDTKTYFLYLLSDRTTTTNRNDLNRAKGKSRTVYTANFEEANQKALDVIQANRYSHNITFNMLGTLIKVGTPIAIKTKKSVIFDSYISSVKITRNRFIEYICGNIRIGFIEKILKERKK